jgi:hypothetical protein
MHARDMRVSDAERERVGAFLRDQALQGRLDDDELEERLGLAMRAVTAGDLERLIADLPHTRVPAATRMAGPRREPPKALLGIGFAALAAIAVPGLVTVALALAIALGVAAVAAIFALGFVFGPFILIALLILGAARRRRPRRHSRHWAPRAY